MKRALPLLLLSACVSQQWTVPQPVFKTREPDAVFSRAVAAVKAHCGGVRSANEESGVVLGPWEAQNTGDGLILTQCIVSLMRGDEHVVDVRVSYGARQCPLSSMDDLEGILPTCQVAEWVPEQVKNRLVDIGAKLEADIKR